MSKVDTLLKIMTYRATHPAASDAQVADDLGISTRYVKQCNQDIQVLSRQFAKHLLPRNQIDLLLSKLDRNIPYERDMERTLQMLFTPTREGVIQLAPNAPSSAESLGIAVCSDEQKRFVLGSILSWLLYEPLLCVDLNGQIEYRLAEEVTPLKDMTQWRIKLRQGLCWNDGNAITVDDVLSTFNQRWWKRDIQQTRRLDPYELHVYLRQPNPIFTYFIRGFVITPAHQIDPYTVMYGPFAVNGNRRLDFRTREFRLIRNPDYYRGPAKLDYVRVRRYRHESSAIRSIEEESLDLMFMRSLRRIQSQTYLIPQSFPFTGASYYVMLISPNSELSRSDKKWQRFVRSIDYQSISLHLSGQLLEPEEQTTEKTELQLTIGCLSHDPQTMVQITQIISRSLGSSVEIVYLDHNPGVEKLSELDALITQIFFSDDYSRLRSFFHSDGGNNLLGWHHKDVDALIEKLDQTVSLPERRSITQEILREVHARRAVILLAPCIDYLLSHMYLEPTTRIANPTDFYFHTADIILKRGQTSP